ncbi:hypothetical protein ACBT_0578 [Aliarcobacter cibarius]|uniref:Uncharacterized protein n=1 Tax=Aliarcobacter cibarius TaxID=255507 RepID=A0A7L5JMW3_9BACT|nr:hypothetical protein [Aliarcobacter cibarius]QKJ26532.1 hypothetical protein ACBT_0578 [Aliarcobacter cibarius]
MVNIHPLYTKECVKTINFINMLTCVAIKDFREKTFESLEDIRCNNNRLNPEILEFFRRFGGIKNVYDYFSDSYTVKIKHIKCIWNYCNKYRVQPHRLRMSTDFTIIKIPIFYEYITSEVA